MGRIKKALVLTGLDREVESYFPDITKRKLEDLLIINSYGAEISQGYSSLMRNIILSVYLEKIEDIYIIVDKYDKTFTINPENLYAPMEEEGVNVEVIETLNYIKAVGSNDVMKWLSGSSNVENIIQSNIGFIKKNPLIPSKVKVHGYIVNKGSFDYQTYVSEESNI
ncbi:hypothetical protein FZC76_10210 [Sutcliffiella horikoshii]|uniref:Carbonic anhydrase n=1 Tax=Sutcliffiella horikoshii TaxID=79883 RepID=A0A5D4T1W8_9BACI|nr:hypothetical protein [Sutcliffiella horikoshii]TYS68116.1 hypothetical protein FZC76_10210 [Sutcliffiella horikoshii]